MSLMGLKFVYDTARQAGRPSEYHGKISRETKKRISAELKKIDFGLVMSTREERRKHLIERIKGRNDEESDYFSWEDMSQDEKNIFEGLVNQFGRLEGCLDRKEFKWDFEEACRKFWVNGTGGTWKNGSNPDHDTLPIHNEVV
jgi:hypothetical protein